MGKNPLCVKILSIYKHSCVPDASLLDWYKNGDTIREASLKTKISCVYSEARKQSKKTKFSRLIYTFFTYK